MSKITLKQLLDLHGLEEGDEFTLGSSAPLKIIDGYPCYKSEGSGYLRIDEEDGILALASRMIYIVKKSPQKLLHGDKYFTISVDNYTWTGDMFDLNNFKNGFVFMDADIAEHRLEEMMALWKEKNNA